MDVALEQLHEDAAILKQVTPAKSEKKKKMKNIQPVWQIAKCKHRNELPP
jgi:hypothetical protein